MQKNLKIFFFDKIEIHKFDMKTLIYSMILLITDSQIYKIY